MTQLDRCKAVIFDMDGLMLDTERIARNAFFDAAQKLNIPFNNSVFHQLIGLNAQGSKRLLMDVYGSDFPYREFVEKVGQLISAHIRQNGIPTKPGIWELLDLLDQFKIPRAVATSTKKETALDHLRSTQLIDRFQFIVGGDEVVRGKPAPDLFLAAAKGLNQIPEQCLVLEDSEPGIQAANSAGMIPIMVPDLVHPSEKMVELTFQIVSSLEKVTGLLRFVFEKALA